MEKRRRARINNCLNELKGILLEAMRKDPARHSKLEKADILELTVSHLKALHRHHNNNNSDGVTRFREGFAECAAEVGRFLASPKSEGIDPQTSGRLLAHLADCINNPSIGSSAPHHHPHHHALHHQGMDGQGNVGTTLNVPPNTPIISLVPSRLASGEIAFVVPGFNSSRGATAPSSAIPLSAMQNLHCNPPPMLSPEVPLELTVSSSSSSGCSLSPTYSSPNGQHHHAHYPPSYFSPGSFSSQPLALVTPKKEDPDGSCWRPW